MPIALPTSTSAIQCLLLAALPVGMATAAEFTITGNNTAAQTLNAGEKGTVSVGGALTVSGDAVAITIAGDGATLNNGGSITQSGSGRVIRDSNAVKTLTINNAAGALMQTADADVIQMNKGKSSVTLNNYGSLVSSNASAGGAQAVDFNAITSGANVINNYAGGQLLATNADAVRTGVNGVVNNSGTIQSTITKSDGKSSDGIDAQNNAGVQIFNLPAGTIEGGRHGITGGQLDAATAFALSVNNSAGATIRGMNGSGINIDGFNGKQLATIVNHGIISGNGVSGDGDGIDVDGLVDITNYGTIRSLNAYSAPADGLAYSEGISAGGGRIVNAGLIEGLVGSGNSNAVGRGITLAGNDLSGGGREGLYGDATITNLAGGTISGQSDSAIVVVGAASGHTVTVYNNSGASILGGGSLNAAIKGNADNTNIVTGGIINGAGSGQAIALGSGRNSVTITGGTITGAIDGGSGGQNTLTVAVGAGNRFSYAGAIANFSKVEIQSGNVTFSGVSSYSGATQLSGGVLTLDGAQRLSADSALILNGGTLRLVHAGADGQGFASLSLTDDSAVQLGGSSLTFGALGAVVSGKTLSFTEAAGGAYAFRLRGDLSSDSSFLALLGAIHINGLGATYAYDGTYTQVLAAVPEPSAYAMLIAGLGLMGMVARRRRNKV
ncbi:autotransporter-associated beta strand protein [Duganella sp. 1224]|uniref:FxDxF family PEP-CTERM protein n=1 Tax=Duganella sp. 1224 TaxID=2587052 RepID=UPI0015CE1C0A|nr:FxDxF family PEP-CTERM protein [Duganella sp. 1224]NYE64219.1 autotransporter-associated beta strand protein [Duganella sp. 1224]